MNLLSCNRDDLNSNSNKTTENRARQCDTQHIEESAQAHGLPIPNMAVNYTNLYKVRDELFNLSLKGLSYTEYYYVLSEFIVDNNLYSNYQDYINVYKDAHLIGYRIVQDYLNQNFTGVLIHESDASKLLQMSSKIKSFHPSQNVLDKLNILESDLNYLKNKPINDVRAFFQ